MSRTLLLRLPDYRLYNTTPATLRHLPVGNLARFQPLLFLEDVGRLVELLAANRYVYSDEANWRSRVYGEWIARTAVELSLASHLVLPDNRRQNHIAIYGSRIARIAAKRLMGFNRITKGVIAVAAAAICPATPLHRVLAPLIARVNTVHSRARELLALSNKQLWICSFTPCTILDDDERTAWPTRHVPDGPLHVIHTLDTRVLPIALATIIGLSAPTSGGLVAPLKGPRWANKYLEIIYRDKDAVTTMLEAFKQAATDYKEGIHLLYTAEHTILRTTALVATEICATLLLN